MTEWKPGQPVKLTTEEQDRCWEAFSAFDKDGSGQIDATELKLVLDMMGMQVSEVEVAGMINKADSANSHGEITWVQFQRVMADQKALDISENEEDTVSAFVAMGGEKDGGGCIDANKLIDIIKNQFEMTIDIESLIQEIDEDGSGEIEYDEFQKLLASSD